MNKCMFLSASILAMLPVSASFAQGVAQSETIEEVVVTAQRREQNLQSVPISVTAVTAKTLQSAGVDTTQNLVSVTPGLVFTTQQRSAQIFIRGVGSSNTAVGDEPNVATYVDGVYMPSSLGNVLSFNNVERVEVLKGPQGTLFGRNATGGLVHVITKDPKAGFSGSASVSYTNYETVEGSAYVTGGTEKLAADIAIYGLRQGEGWGTNLVTGDDTNLLRQISLRSKVLWRPNDKDRLTFAADWSENHSTIGLVRNALPGVLQSAGVKNGTAGPAVLARGGLYDSVSDLSATPNNTELTNWGVSLKYQHAFDAADLTFTSAYREESSDYLLDSDAGPYNVVHIPFVETTRSLQNEILLTGGADRLNWVAGVFIFHIWADYPFAIDSETIPSLNQRDDRGQNSSSYAGFVQGTYSVLPATRLTLGARYTVDKRRLYAHDFTSAGNPAPLGTNFFNREAQQKWSKPSYRFAIDHDVTDDVLVYASYNRGFKSGTFNTAGPSAPAVNPEILDAFEVGAKSEFFRRLLRFNVSVFHYKYKDIQLSQNNAGVLFLFNAARAKIDGVEFETLVAPPVPTGRLQLRASASVLNAKYTEFLSAPVAIPRGAPAGGNASLACPVPATPGNVCDVSGNRMTRAPKWTLSAGIDYSLPIGEAGELGFNVDYYHNSGIFFEPANRLQQSAYDLLNAQISYSFGADLRYRVRVFGRNITNQEYFTSATEGAFGDLASPGAPRMYGAGIDVQF